MLLGTTLEVGVARRAAKPAGADLGAPPNTRARAARATRSFAGNGEQRRAQEAAPLVSLLVLSPRVLTLSPAADRPCLLPTGGLRPLPTGGPHLLPPTTAVKYGAAPIRALRGRPWCRRLLPDAAAAHVGSAAGRGRRQIGDFSLREVRVARKERRLIFSLRPAGVGTWGCRAAGRLEFYTCRAHAQVLIFWTKF
jgi:hypothetical protein